MLAPQTLLADCPAQPPCGPNLEYDPAFQALELAARGRPEQAMGEARIEAVAPDWPAVARLATELLARTKDVRVAVLLARAWLRTEGLAGLHAGLGLLHALLERFWDALHPQADEGDLTMRLNALADLADAQTMLADIRAATLAQVPRKGRVTVREALIAAGRLQPGAAEPVPAPAAVEALVREAAAQDAASIEAARALAPAARALHAFVARQVGDERAADLLPLVEPLAFLGAWCAGVLGTPAAAPPGANAPALGTEPAAVAAAAAATGSTAVTAPPGAGPADAAAGPATAAGTLRSRDDAVRLLEAVGAFIERTEPASPAPLFIRRAQRLLGMNFIQIIEELAPDSLPAVRAQAGAAPESA